MTVDQEEDLKVITMLINKLEQKIKNLFGIVFK